MSWLKHVVVDLAVTLLIALTTTRVLPAWAEWIVYIYTPFMLILKITAYFAELKKMSPKKQDEGQPPAWFYHVLYAVNVGMLGFSGWWATFAQWIVIWFVSILIDRKT